MLSNATIDLSAGTGYVLEIPLSDGRAIAIWSEVPHSPREPSELRLEELAYHHDEGRRVSTGALISCPLEDLPTIVAALQRISDAVVRSALSRVSAAAWAEGEL